eukprot:763270-Hanusia_phi.AAC.1
MLAQVKEVKAKDVAEGGLPGGLAEYMSIIKSKKQWGEIGNRVANGHADMSEEEWKNVQGYLRKFFDTAKEMEVVSKAFSPDEQKAVAEVAKEFRKAVKAIDKPAAAKDWETFIAQHKVILGYIDEFQDIRAGKKKLQSNSQSVPDEL